MRLAGASAAALALTGLTAVMAMVARSPLSRSTPIDPRSAATPVTALFMLTVGAGILALTALAIVMWPGRRRRGDDPELVPEEPQIRWIWKLLAILLPFALGAVLVPAAALGRRTASRTTAPGGHPVSSFAGPPRPASAGNGFAVPSWLPWTALAIVVPGDTQCRAITRADAARISRWRC